MAVVDVDGRRANSGLRRAYNVGFAGDGTAAASGYLVAK